MAIFDFLRRKSSERRERQAWADGVPGARKPRVVQDRIDREAADGFDVAAEIKRVKEARACTQNCGPTFVAKGDKDAEDTH